MNFNTMQIYGNSSHCQKFQDRQKAPQWKPRDLVASVLENYHHTCKWIQLYLNNLQPKTTFSHNYDLSPNRLSPLTQLTIKLRHKIANYLQISTSSLKFQVKSSQELSARYYNRHLLFHLKKKKKSNLKQESWLVFWVCSNFLQWLWG